MTALGGWRASQDPARIGRALREALAVAAHRAVTEDATRTVARALIRSVAPTWEPRAKLPFLAWEAVGALYERTVKALEGFGDSYVWRGDVRPALADAIRVACGEGRGQVFEVAVTAERMRLFDRSRRPGRPLKVAQDAASTPIAP